MKCARHLPSARVVTTLAALTLTALLLWLNFDPRVVGDSQDRVTKQTPDQMYEPTYPDDGSATFGVIFAANGPFVRRAFESALALGDFANSTLFSDANGTRECQRLKRNTLRKEERDDILTSRGVRCVAVPKSFRNAWGFREAKLWAFTATPYDKTLYLDADAYPCARYDWLRQELSPALERYDVLATHSSYRSGFPHALHWLNAGFYSLNPASSLPVITTKHGVVAFDARSPDARGVFERWLDTYQTARAKQHDASSHTKGEEKTVLTDQRLFNEGVLASRARVMVLPPEFNCKSNYKSIRYEWAKRLSPALYRRVRKNAQCCTVRSIGTCVVDHECRFPRARQVVALLDNSAGEMEDLKENPHAASSSSFSSSSLSGGTPPTAARGGSRARRRQSKTGKSRTRSRRPPPGRVSQW